MPGFTGDEELQRIGIKSSKISEPGTVQKSINFAQEKKSSEKLDDVKYL